MNYRGLKIGVFYKNISWGNKWIKDFIAQIDNSCISKIQMCYPRVILKDGTTITAYPANTSSRGTVIDKAFVDPDVDEEIIRNVIDPLIRHTRFIEIEK